jgi:ribosomal protein S18 acetylase RimI-like enzyme
MRLRPCDHEGVAITLSTSRVGDLADVVRSLREWQHDAAPMQLHPGDLGWFWRHGAEVTAAAVRTWSRSGQILAVGLLDGPELVRLTMAPEARRDEELARQLIADVADPERDVLPSGKASFEVPNGSLVADRLLEDGWSAGESWTPLRRDLKEPVGEPGLRVEVVGPELASDYTVVHRSSFGSPTLTDELWQAMVTGLPYRDARCLLAYDDQGNAVAEVTVWSAGPGRPGLLEPMGVHAEHRRRGYGKAVCLAAAAALRSMGSSSAIVCTPSANAAAVATYVSAGFWPLPERRDRSRNA